jgi:hypothetical protein
MNTDRRRPITQYLPGSAAFKESPWEKLAGLYKRQDFAYIVCAVLVVMGVTYLFCAAYISEVLQ